MIRKSYQVDLVQGAWAEGKGKDRTSGNGFCAMGRECIGLHHPPFSQRARKGWGTLDLVLVGGWPVLFLVMLSRLRVSYPLAFGGEGCGRALLRLLEVGSLVGMTGLGKLKKPHSSHSGLEWATCPSFEPKKGTDEIYSCPLIEGDE